MKLAVLGINFRTAPVELREKVSLRPDQIPGELARIGAGLPTCELALVSTCNRTELFVGGLDAAPGKDELIRVMVAGLDASGGQSLAEHFYLKTGLDAAEHLLAVAASLDSMVVGETEILGQVKQAYAIAVEQGTSGSVLRTLFETAFRCAKRVHTETDICRGRVSVSSIAVEFAEKVFDNLAEKTVMIVGAGETAELSLKSLIDRGVREVLVVNRSLHRGTALAEKYGGRALQFELLNDYLPRSDIVISSTGAPHCVIHADAVRQAVRERHGRPILLVDIAVPRDIEAEAGNLENVYLYNIDDLQRIADANLARRQEAIEQAWRIVREGTAELAAAFEGTDLRFLMQQFDRQANRIKEMELERALSKQKLNSLPEESREEIRMLVQKTINRMLASPRAALHRASKNGQWHEYAKVVRDLFGFDDKKDEEE